MINNELLAKDAFEVMQERLRIAQGNYLETGSFNGDFVARLAKQFPEKQFYCVDPFIEDGNTTHITKVDEGRGLYEPEYLFLKNTSSLPNVALFRQTSKSFYSDSHPSFLWSLKIQTILIDGHHRFDHVINDIYLSMDLLRGVIDGLIYLDDFNTADVASAVSFACLKFKPMITKVYRVKDGGFVIHTRHNA